MSEELTAPALRELTDKESRFVDEYCVDFNGTAAAKRAGYSPKSAKYEARDLMKRPEVRDAINACVDELKDDARCRREVILGEIAEMAYATPSSVGGKNVKLRALELLGKAGAIFIERASIENPDGSPVNSGRLTSAEIAAEVARIIKQGAE